jgi:hypothetical protein
MCVQPASKPAGVRLSPAIERAVIYSIPETTGKIIEEEPQPSIILPNTKIEAISPNQNYTLAMSKRASQARKSVFSKSITPPSTVRGQRLAI